MKVPTRYFFKEFREEIFGRAELDEKETYNDRGNYLRQIKKHPEHPVTENLFVNKIGNEKTYREHYDLYTERLEGVYKSKLQVNYNRQKEGY